MYIALKELNTKSGPVKPGQVVKEALNWSEPVLMAHLNLEWIKFVPDIKPTQKTPADPVTAPVVEKEASTVNTVGTWSCWKCEKSFTSKRGLSVHAKMAHKSE